jgi:hypothetical protein
LSPVWQYSTPLDLVDHWQALIAGIFALIAAVIAVVGTAWIERGKARVEVEAIRSSLAVEFRFLLARAYAAHKLFIGLSQQQTPITTRQVESFSQMPVPVVYPATAHKIGLLGARAMDVVAFYSVIEVVVSKVNELQRYRTPDDISPSVIAGVGAGFLMACKAGLPLLPQLKTGVSTDGAKDAELKKLIEAA